MFAVSTWEGPRCEVFSLKARKQRFLVVCVDVLCSSTAAPSAFSGHGFSHARFSAPTLKRDQGLRR